MSLAQRRPWWRPTRCSRAHRRRLQPALDHAEHTPAPRIGRTRIVVPPLALHHDLSCAHVHPEPLVRQRTHDIVLQLTACEDGADIRLPPERDRGRDRAWRMAETQVPTVATVENLNDRAEEGQDEERCREQVHGRWAQDHSGPPCIDISGQGVLRLYKVDGLCEHLQVHLLHQSSATETLVWTLGKHSREPA
jgi:hypothetical protein